MGCRSVGIKKKNTLAGGMKDVWERLVYKLAVIPSSCPTNPKWLPFCAALRTHMLPDTTGKGLKKSQ